MALGASFAGAAKVILTADTANFDRGMRESQRSFHGHVNTIEKDTERMGRGILAGSGAFHHLGRSIAFASGAFLGAAGFTAVVRSSIDAAEELGKAHRGLDAQIKANNQNFVAAEPLIEKVDARMAHFGHTAVESEGALSRLARATGDVTEASKLMTLAADLAAARHIDLDKAALLVGKVYDGNVSALNRYGIAIAKGTSVTDALAIAQRRLSGQAAAGVTPMEKLHATVTNLQAKLGEALLPTINRIADALSGWLGQTKNQERVQRDFQEVIGTVTSVVKGLSGAFRTLSGFLGGTRRTLLLLTGAFVAFKATTATLRLVNLAQDVGLIGTKAVVAKGEVAALRTALIGLSGAAVIGGLGLVGYALYKAFSAPQPQKVGTTSVGTNVVSSGGQLYVQSPGGGRLTRLAPGSTYTPTGPGGADRSNHPGVQGAGAGLLWSGDHSGLKPSFRASLAACVADAGGTQIDVTSGKRSNSTHPGGPANMGAQNSNHLTGSAADGTCVINGHRYPLGDAPLDYAKFGLRAGRTFAWNGAPDIYHVDDGSNIGGIGAGTPVSVSAVTAGAATAKAAAPKPPSAASVAATKNAAAAGKIDAALDKQIGVTDLTGIGYQIGALRSGFTTKTVKIPGIGKILTQVSLVPTVKAWQQVVTDLKKKYAAAKARLASWHRSLKKAKAARFPNKAVIAHINAQIKNVTKVMGLIKQDLGVAISEIAQLDADAAAKVQQAADEADAAVTDVPPDTTTVESGGVDVSSPADAGVTADPASAAAALTPPVDPAVAAQAQQTSFLIGLRDIHSFQSNILDRAIAGATIIVNNTFPTPPPDPHTFTAGLQFELKALIG